MLERNVLNADERAIMIPYQFPITVILILADQLGKICALLIQQFQVCGEKITNFFFFLFFKKENFYFC